MTLNETKLREYYDEYLLIEKIINEKTLERDKLYNAFKGTKAGKLYLSLSEEQQKAFEYIYSDTTYKQYLFYKKQAFEFEEAKNKLLLKISQDMDVFPFKQEDELKLYIKAGIETYCVFTEESTENLNIADDLKEFIQTIIFKINSINNIHDFKKSDIPLIKIIYEKIKNEANYDEESIRYAVINKVNICKNSIECPLIYPKENAEELYDNLDNNVKERGKHVK